MSVVRYSTSETTVFLGTHFGSFLVDLSDKPPSEKFLLDLQSLSYFPFFQTSEKLQLNWQMNLLQSCCISHYGGFLNHLYTHSC